MRVPTILVVEGDAIARNVVVQILTQQGFRVFEADNAEEALTVCRALRGQHLDLVIAEHSLPRTTSRTLGESIVKLCPNAKILHVSGWPFSKLQQENALLPGSSFLQKPFTAGQLRDLVRSILGARTQ